METSAAWGGMGTPINPTDAGCQAHDQCYSRGGIARFVLQGKNKKTIEETTGKDRCGKPFELENLTQSASGYPKYDAITVNGITEIFEQRKPEDILYVTDDPAVWKQYRAKGCD